MADIAESQLALPWLGLLLAAGIALILLLHRVSELRAAHAELADRLQSGAQESAALLNAQQQGCEQLMRSATVGYLDWDLATAKAELGGAWASMLGYGHAAAEQLRSTSGPWLALCHPRDRRRMQRLLRELVAGERERANGEFRLRSARDHWHWVRIDAQVVAYDGAGKPRRILATQVDINRIKHNEYLLHAERHLFAAGPVIVLNFEAEAPHRLHQVSSSFHALCGHSKQPLDALLHPDDLAGVAGLIAQAVAYPGTQAQREVRLATPDGRWPWYLMRVVADRPNWGTLLRAYLVDINPLKEAESKAVIQTATQQEMVRKMAGTQHFLTTLQQLTELLQLCDNEEESRQIIEQGGMQLFPGWSGALTFADDEGTMTVAAQWGESFTPPHTEEGQCWAVRRGRLHRYDVDTAAHTLSPLCGHFDDGQSLPAGIKHAICAPLLKSFDRPGALHLITAEPLSDETLDATAWGAETLANALKLSLGNLRLRTSLREQAVRDVMTELYNRRYFDETLGRELSRSQRTGDALTLAILDIDHFKVFNDNFGHEAGDQVLKTVADRMRHFVRAYDIACRVGGEELAIIMPRVNMEEACGRLDQLRTEIASYVLTHNGMQLPPVTVSIGVADLSAGPPEELQRRADTALYAAKHGGRNRVICWQEGLEASSFGAFGEGQGTPAGTI